MKILRLLVLLVLTMGTSAWGRPNPAASETPHAGVNFRYIEGQRAEVRLGDRGTHTIWRVDADALTRRSAWHDVGPAPPAFKGRSDLVSTDDIAWVALAYMKQAEVDKNAASHAREEARKALKTLLVLQRNDGSFLAYQSADNPNESVALYSASDWMATARAIQAMGAGVKTFASDGGLVDGLQKALTLSLQRIQATWGRSEHALGHHYDIDGMRLPAWLPYNRVDGAAAIVLGLADWYATRRNDAPLQVLRAFADALVEAQRGSPAQYPWNGILPQADKPSLWYPDGALQGAALIRAREVLQKPTYLNAALAESNYLRPHVLTAYDLVWQMAPRPDVWPRVPGAAASLAINEAALYRATSKDPHGLMAALFVSWLTTPQPKGGAVYDEASGRCADVVTPEGPSRTSSPGSSARAIYALLCVAETSGAHQINAVAIGHDAAPIVLQACDGRPVTDPITIQETDLPGGPRRLARVAHDNAFWLKFDVGTPASYRVDMVYVKDRTQGAVINVRLDGDAILSLPLGTTDSDAVPSRQEAVAPTRLDPGLHTLGVRGNGLLLSSGSLLDVFVVQPVVAWRLWRLPDGYKVAVVANFGPGPDNADLPASLLLPLRSRHQALWAAGADPTVTARGDVLEAARNEEGVWRIKVPGNGCGAVEW